MMSPSANSRAISVKNSFSSDCTWLPLPWAGEQLPMPVPARGDVGSTNCSPGHPGHGAALTAQSSTLGTALAQSSTHTPGTALAQPWHSPVTEQLPWAPLAQSSTHSTALGTSLDTEHHPWHIPGTEHQPWHSPGIKQHPQHRAASTA